MSVVSTHQDPDTLTFTIVSELAAPPERVWQLWADPRLLERWWGPPTWPTTFVRHEVEVGGESRYVMTGPDGETSGGWWRITAVEEPHRLEFEDGFSEETGEPADDMPVTQARVDLEQTGTGTRMTVRSVFASLDDMRQVVAMGMVEGMTQAMNQMDEVLLSAV